MCYGCSRYTVACSAIVIGRMLHDRGGNSNTPNTNYVYAVLAHNVCRMPPKRQSARPKTRATGKRFRTQSTAAPVDPSDIVESTAALVDPVVRPTAAKPTRTAWRQWEAEVMNRLDATENLSRDMHQMRSLLESALPGFVSGSPPGGQSGTPVTTTSSLQRGVPADSNGIRYSSPARGGSLGIRGACQSGGVSCDCGTVCRYER